MSWAPSTLEAAADIVAGYAFPSSGYARSETAWRLLRGITVGPQRLDWSEPLYWSRTPGDGLGKFELANGDIVIAMDRPWITEGFRVAQLATADTPALLVQRVARLRAKKGFDGRFLYHLMCSGGLQQHLQKRHTETTVPHVSHKDIASYAFVAPPLPEQKRIAAILDKADAIRRKRQEAIRLTEELLRSAFLEMFGDPVTNPKGWEVKKLGELIPDRGMIVDGPFGSSLKPAEYVPAGVRVIRNFNIGRDEFDQGEYKYVTEEKFREIARSEVRANDLLISTKGTVGNVCVMPALPGLAVLSASGTVRLRPQSPILSSFLSAQMSLPMYRAYIQKSTAGSIQRYLNLSSIREFEVMLPPEGAQEKFVAWSRGVRGLLLNQTNTFAEVGTLVSSLTQRAFSGSM